MEPLKYPPNLPYSFNQVPLLSLSFLDYQTLVDPGDPCRIDPDSLKFCVTIDYSATPGPKACNSSWGRSFLFKPYSSISAKLVRRKTRLTSHELLLRQTRMEPISLLQSKGRERDLGQTINYFLKLSCSTHVKHGHILSLD